MSRAYVQPKAIIGSLQFLNPNNEVLSNNKILTNLDSPLQSLNPGNTIYHVILPDVIDCEGSFFYIINRSEENSGLLSIYEPTHTDKYLDLGIGQIALAICIAAQWGVFYIGSGTFSPNGSGSIPPSPPGSTMYNNTTFYGSAIYD